MSRSAPRWLSELRPRRSDLRGDALAAVPGAISAVPDGMASAVLVGVSPAYGLYASFAGPIGAGLTTSTRMMVVTTTTSAALAAGSALAAVPEAERPGALVLLTTLTGGLMILAGLLRAGRYVRFVSRSVMLGFLTGVAVNIVLGQLPDLLGATAQGELAIQKAWFVLSHPSSVDPASLAAGAGALGLLIVLDRTRLSMVSSLAAVVVPTLAVGLLGARGVATVADSGAIPRGLPELALPSLSAATPSILVGAMAVTVIVLIQGAGVAQAAPNPDGSPSRLDQDFVAQGVGNLASGMVRGIPVGGSVGATALNVSSGGRSRWSSVLIGVWVLLVLVAFAGPVGQVVVPTLAAVLMYAAYQSLRPGELWEIWRTGQVSRLALAATFVATLLLPVAAAVGVGVLLSLILQLNRGALDLAVVRLVPQPDGRLTQRPVPDRLPDQEPVVLDVYGSLLYAGARTLEARLPDPHDAHQPVVVLRLRGRTSLGATFFGVVASYAHALEEREGHLYLSGVDPTLLERFQRCQTEDVQGRVTIFAATEVIGQSTLDAFQDARAWLVTPRSGATDV